MNIHATKEFQKKVRKIAKENAKLYLRTKKTVEILRTNTHHPSLRLHKMKDTQRWSVSVNMSIRILYEYIDDCILLVDIGSHDDVCR